MRKSKHPVFRAIWCSSNVLLAAVLFALAYMGVREFSMQPYGFALGWYADSQLRIPRFHLREHMTRAGVAFFSTPEIKQ